MNFGLGALRQGALWPSILSLDRSKKTLIKWEHISLRGQSRSGSAACTEGLKRMWRLGVAALRLTFLPTSSAGLRPRLTPSRRSAAVLTLVPAIYSTQEFLLHLRRSLLRAVPFEDRA
jgi:hypothetical protein